MIIGETINVAMGAIRANKLRSFLTMLGIIIGIGAVITMVALGEGAKRIVEARLSTLGTNVLTVRPGQEFFGGVDRGDARLTADGALAIKNLQSPNIRAVSPEMGRRQQVAYNGNNANLQITGVWPEYFEIQNSHIQFGRSFTEREARGRRRVGVLGARVGERLNVPTQMLVGNTISIRGIPIEVIGVLAEKGDQGFSNPDETLYIPLATAQFRVIGTERVSTIHVQATDARTLDGA